LELKGKDVELGKKDVELKGKDVELKGKDVELKGKDVELERARSVACFRSGLYEVGPLNSGGRVVCHSSRLNRLTSEVLRLKGMLDMRGAMGT
jgi:hypothetical protein